MKFITLTDSYSGKLMTLNINTIVSFGEGTAEGKPATWIQTVNMTNPNQIPYFAKETPSEINEILEQTS